jgi:putative radical SAM enzyme (TIGR03279 family)
MLNTISSVDAGCPLEGRVQPGDELLFVNRHEIRDVLDYKYWTYDKKLLLEFKNAGKIRVRKEAGQDLGLNFATYLMDRPTGCANKCVFCFIDQLPRGLRSTLYFKDDDARLSFLTGSYITCTNLSERELQRICDLRVSPLNVSVHATDPDLRREMLGNPRAGEALNIMRRFAAAGITMNCQIVCCPGLNDGEELMRSMRDLARLYPQVRSVSIVPVGLTKFRENLYPLKPFTPELAAKTLDEVTLFGDECIRKYGNRIFFCGDELYLKCGRAVPEDDFYEDYYQLENGVGMLRLLETEFCSALSLSDPPEQTQRFSIATGVAAAPLFAKLISAAHGRYEQIHGTVYPIVNEFFGSSVDVSGLVTGGDLIAQLKGRDLGDRLLISQNMIRRVEKDFLDDVTLLQAEKELGVPVIPVEQDGFALWDAMSGVPANENDHTTQQTQEEYYQYN